MGKTIQIKRGPKNTMPILAQGELGMTTDSGAEGCVEEELSHRHSGESGGNTDELADGGDETAEEGGGGAVVAEIGFGVLNLRAVNQADVPETTVCETIDQGATEPTRKPIVDERAEVCTGGGNQHHKQDV